MDLGGTIIVTGAAGGLGVAIAKQFTQNEYKLNAIFTVRDHRDNRNVKSLQDVLQNDRRCQIRSLDLNNLENVRTFATNLAMQVSAGEIPPITALCFNAGYISSYGQSFTNDGYEKTFQINYLANLLLAYLLLPVINRTQGRIVFITSFTHDPLCKQAKPLSLPKELFLPTEYLAKPAPDKGNLSQAGFRRYATSKMCAMMLMHALQSRVEANPRLFGDIVVLAVDPGLVGATGLNREQTTVNKIVLDKVLVVLTPLVQKISSNSILRTKERSAKDILDACIGMKGPAAGEEAKGMVVNGSKLQNSSEESRDGSKVQLLWKESLKLLDLTEVESQSGRADEPEVYG
jgi:NAD(P)-dependent dehydrogenase (short-subunit alcohol dehydrogenase family)